MCAVQVVWPDRSGQPAGSVRPFAINAAEWAGTYVIRLEGELDLGRCPRFERALEVAERSRARRILIDLDELVFIDAAGLQSLLGACRRSAGNGDRLQVTRGKGSVADKFRLTALDLTLPFGKDSDRFHTNSTPKRPIDGHTRATPDRAG